MFFKAIFIVIRILFDKSEYLQNELKSPIEANKEKYYPLAHILKKLMNPSTSTKIYWSISKSFLNNKKIPCISPLIHWNRYNTKYRAEFFNNVFANQCSPINNSRVFSLVLFRIRENVTSSISFSWNDIAKVIQKLDPNKGHGHDMISIRMIEICGNSM